MTERNPLDMGRITAMMRAGQLSQATQMIQAGLGQGSSPDPSLPSGARMRDFTMPDFTMPEGMPGLTLPGGAGAGLMARAFGRAGSGPSGRAAPEPDLPPGAAWTWRRHQAAGEARDVRLYLPASLAGETPAGLLLLLHGCTQDPDDFARGTAIMEAAERHRVIVVVPAQPARANMNLCWTWFDPRHAATGSGEAAFLTDLTRTIAHEFAVPPDLRFAAGLSAGGAMAVILGAVFADDFGAVVCHSGLPHGAARDMGGAFAAMSQGGSDAGTGVGCRLLVLHGSADATVSPKNADAVLAQALRRQPGLVRRAADAGLDGHRVRIWRHRDPQGRLRIESWRIDGLGHAWSGGAPDGSHTAPGPSATRAMMRFCLG